MNTPRIKEIKIFKDRVIKTFIHGFLHLLGFDHTNEKDYKKMIKEENKIYQEVISKINNGKGSVGLLINPYGLRVIISVVNEGL